jgi:acetyltransferase-like isoleucine patch superfamily enzyme
MSSIRFKHKFLMLYSGVVRLLMFMALDEIAVLRRLRGFLYGLGMAKCGRNLQVSSSTILWGLERIDMGRDVYIGPNVTIICIDQLRIGNGVLIAPHVVITNGNHVFKEGAYSHTENSASPIVIGDGSWVGANATVVAGVTIGKGALIGAGSVVTKDVKDFERVGGVPARTLGQKGQ